MKYIIRYIKKFFEEISIGIVLTALALMAALMLMITNPMI